MLVCPDMISPQSITYTHDQFSQVEAFPVQVVAYGGQPPLGRPDFRTAVLAVSHPPKCSAGSFHMREDIRPEIRYDIVIRPYGHAVAGREVLDKKCRLKQSRCVNRIPGNPSIVKIHRQKVAGAAQSESGDDTGDGNIHGMLARLRQAHVLRGFGEIFPVTVWICRSGKHGHTLQTENATSPRLLYSVACHMLCVVNTNKCLYFCLRFLVRWSKPSVRRCQSLVPWPK